MEPVKKCSTCTFNLTDDDHCRSTGCHDAAGDHYPGWMPRPGAIHAALSGKGERQTVMTPAKGVADSGGGAVKADTDKTPLGLLSRAALLAEADVLGFGARKYAAHNWRKGMKFSRLGDAALRHLLAWLDGEDTDPETGLSHLAHLRCCAGFLIEYQAKGLGEDDRFKPA